jgi:fumarate hydratase subunit beta
MDSYTGALLDAGLKCIIGKGKRSSDTRRQLIKHKAVYLAAVGGAGALIAQTIKKARPLAYQELGTEAVFEIEVENFPAVVINDIYGGDLYQEGRAKFKIE